MQNKQERVKQTERNLAKAKVKNLGVHPPGRKDEAERKPEKGRLPNPGQSIVNSDQSSD